MRGFLLMAIYAGGLWVVDTTMCEGRYTQEFGHEVQSATRQARYWLNVQLNFLAARFQLTIATRCRRSGKPTGRGGV